MVMVAGRRNGLRVSKGWVGLKGDVVLDVAGWRGLEMAEMCEEPEWGASGRPARPCRRASPWPSEGRSEPKSEGRFLNTSGLWLFGTTVPASSVKRAACVTDRPVGRAAFAFWEAAPPGAAVEGDRCAITRISAASKTGEPSGWRQTGGNSPETTNVQILDSPRGRIDDRLGRSQRKRRRQKVGPG